MAPVDFSSKTYLVVDDFADMRAMIRNMLASLGATRLDQARDGKEAIALMEQKHYDVVLCDYNLGPGKDGQQVLEEARRRSLIGVDSIFIMVTAENTREMVMGAVEYAPDNYLTKPFSKDLIKSRLIKLFERKADLAAVNRALTARDYIGAINELDRLIAARPRNLAELLRLKADLCLSANRLDEAQAIYDQVLQKRDLNWAHLGKGRVFFQRKQYGEAHEVFVHLVELDPNYVAAYDWLARTQVAEEAFAEAEQTLKKAVRLSPRHVERQQRLGDLALDNGDGETAEAALTRAVNLAKHSVLNHPALHASLAKAKSANGKHDEALKVAANIASTFAEDPEAAVYQASAAATIHANKGDREAAAKALQEAEAALADAPELSAALALEMARVCARLGETERATGFLHRAIANNHDDHEFLAEVMRVSHEGGLAEKTDLAIRGIQQEIIKTNNTGVRLIREGDYEAAVALLRQAADEMPGNKTINLNAAKACIIKMENLGVTSEDVQQVRRCIERVEKSAPDDWRLADVKTRLREIALKLNSGS